MTVVHTYFYIVVYTQRGRRNLKLKMTHTVVHVRGLVAGPYAPAAKHYISLEIYQSQLRNKSYGILLIVIAAELEVCSLRRKEYCLCSRREGLWWEVV